MVNALFGVGVVGLLLCGAVPKEAAVEFPPQEDLPVPSVPGMGNMGGGRLALPVTIRWGESVTPTLTITNRQSGKPMSTTPVPPVVLSKYALAISRGFFEEAAWTKEGKAGKGRELVITAVKILAQQGPLYEVQVTVDRLEDGKRLGTATGTAMVTPDRSADYAASAFAGPFAGLVAHDASRAKANKDQVTIMHGTLQAFERALVQLAAYWAGEQATQQMMKAQQKK